MQSFEVFIGAGVSTSTVAHWHDWQLSANLGKSLCASPQGSCRGQLEYPRDTALASHSVSNLSESKAGTAVSFMSKTQNSDTHFCSVLLVHTSALFIVGSDYEGSNARVQRSLGAVLEVVSHNQEDHLVLFSAFPITYIRSD